MEIYKCKWKKKLNCQNCLELEKYSKGLCFQLEIQYNQQHET